MAKTPKTKWQLDSRTAGWVQGGRATADSPHPKCGAHFVKYAKSTQTACTRLAVRGKEAPQGFAHYNLRWFLLADKAAATGAVCRACELVASK